jgi:hypothetical protein
MPAPSWFPIRRRTALRGGGTSPPTPGLTAPAHYLWLNRYVLNSALCIRASKGVVTHRFGSLTRSAPKSSQAMAQFPSTFPPPDAGPCGMGRSGWGRAVSAEAVNRSFAHVRNNDRGQVGTRRDPRGDGAATCKIAGIAFTGSNPVPAT